MFSIFQVEFKNNLPAVFQNDIYGLDIYREYTYDIYIGNHFRWIT